ncbi:glucosyltransferase Alg6 [Coprinopsis sp. MPI-PUGE-AT-0042]|nr:glucosyltransferase Alg6 [Coprinopsis sp. MPI-PUGE-AT-0042]
MYGDYEAQRHWMELTVHLPFRQWYTYDLQYWGLDYPPLTAYASWICGIVAHYVAPEWVALDASRGIETPGSKLFMRLTVLFWDLLIYIPALLMFIKTWQGTRSQRTQEQAFLILLLQPALLLVDHGHFQYNSSMLGLTLLALNFLSQGHDLYGAVFFVLSLGFKQMSLYYAPAIGSYLLAKCLWLGWVKGLRLFTRLGATTAISFALLFSPFFLPPLAPSFIANFWCASNVVINGDEDRARGWLVKLSTVLTAIGFTPSVVGLLRAAWVTQLEDSQAPASSEPVEEPSRTTHEGASQKPEDTSAAPNFISLLPYALLTSSMSFFLFSFQVHEKTILLPLLPLTLLMSAAPTGSTLHSWGALGNNIAVFSMWPLLKRDGQGLACLATLALWNRVAGYNPASWLWVKESSVKENLAYGASIALLFLESVMPIPARYPDLFPVLNVLISTPVFVLIWLWSIKCGLEVGWAVAGGWGQRGKSTSASDPSLPMATPTMPASGAENFDGMPS